MFQTKPVLMQLKTGIKLILTGIKHYFWIQYVKKIPILKNDLILHGFYTEISTRRKLQ